MIFSFQRAVSAEYTCAVGRDVCYNFLDDEFVNLITFYSNIRACQAFLIYFLSNDDRFTLISVEGAGIFEHWVKNKRVAKSGGDQSG